LITRNRGLVLLAVLVLIIALVVMFPARVAYKWAASPFVAMSGIHGTIWNGGAREFSTYGVYLQGLTWKIHPWRLLTGTLHYDVSGSPVSGFFSSEVTVALGGKLTLRNLSASVPLAMLEQAAGISGLRGTASLQFERLELVNGRAAALDGNLSVANLVVPIITRTPLGAYKADFFTQNDGIIASVEDAGGVVDLAGSLELGADKSYKFNGLVAPQANTPDELRQRLQFLGSPNERGQYELPLEGTY
jgi:general secretion pathway protein N